MNTKLIILGGFLGSGKTTLMLTIAELYKKMGLKIAIITNDQGDILVDTNTSIEKGFSTRQVSSGCYCCKFIRAFHFLLPNFLQRLEMEAALKSTTSRQRSGLYLNL